MVQDVLKPETAAGLWGLLRSWIDQTAPEPWGMYLLAAVPVCVVVALWVRFVVNPLRRGGK